MKIYIPVEERDNALEKALYILGNLNAAICLYDNQFGYEERRKKDRWKKTATEFLEQIGYVATPNASILNPNKN